MEIHLLHTDIAHNKLNKAKMLANVRVVDYSLMYIDTADLIVTVKDHTGAEAVGS